MRKLGPFGIQSSRVVYKNPWILVREDRVVSPSGKGGVFGVVEMVAGSSVLPIDEDGTITLVREYKYGIRRMSVEVMSGGLDKRETPLQGAKRELKEELGIRARRWQYLGFVDPFTTIVRSPNHMFLASGLSYGSRHLDPDEQIRLVRMPIGKAARLVEAGKITHSASCVLILRGHRLWQEGKTRSVDRRKP
ncbi:MAG: NUDIX hydrolase [Candidatus Ryanbacteria bacterium]|nr:NUDIX hydrolase [Candidatus Ryanbacteria bacterium]